MQKTDNTPSAYIFRHNRGNFGKSFVELGKHKNQGKRIYGHERIYRKHGEIPARIDASRKNPEKACKKKNNWYLNDCEIYVTLEPCKMCVGAIEQARIKKIYYAAKSEKPLPRKPIFKKIDDNDQSQNMLKTFFENKRK